MTKTLQERLRRGVRRQDRKAPDNNAAERALAREAADALDAAEAESVRLREALGDIENIQPMFEGGMGISKVNLQNTLEEARQIARDALRGEGE